MTLNVYIDGFNLYYGCLRGTGYKWLDLGGFCRASFPSDQIRRIRYFTARLKAQAHNPDKPQRQVAYLRALATLPELTIHEGSYLRKVVRMPLHPLPPAPRPPTYVKVLKTEEKGSDVNLATYLLVDAFDGESDGVVIISNDSDLAEPIRIVRTRFGRKVIILHPCSLSGRGPSLELKIAAGLRSGSASRIVENALLAAHQFPKSMTDAVGTIHKPPTW